MRKLAVLFFLILGLWSKDFLVNGERFTLKYPGPVIESEGRTVYRGGKNSYYIVPFSCEGKLRWLELVFENGTYTLLLDREPFFSSSQELYEPRGLCYEGQTIISVGVKDRFLVFWGEREYWIPPVLGPEVNPSLKIKAGLPYIEFSEYFRGKFLKRGSFIPPQIIPFRPPIKTPKEPFWFNYSLAPNKYIAFGDSITYGCGYGSCEHDPPIGYPPRLEKLLNERLGPSQVVNRGVPGEETREGILRINSVLEEEKARYLLLNEGTNDVVHAEYPLSVTEESSRYLIETSLAYGTYVVYSTIIPRKDWFWYAPYFHNKLLSIVKLQRKLAREYRLPLADFYKAFMANPDWMEELLSDGNHPSRKGYQLMAKVWEEAIETIPPYPPHDFSATTSAGRVYISWEGGGESDLQGFLLCSQGVCLDLGLRFSWALSPTDLIKMSLYSYDKAGNKSQPMEIDFSEER